MVRGENMTKRKIEAVEHLNIIEVSKENTIKRYEVSAENGYIFSVNGEKTGVSSLMIFPAKLGLENILSQITVQPAENL